MNEVCAEYAKAAGYEKQIYIASCSIHRSGNNACLVITGLHSFYGVLCREVRHCFDGSYHL